MTLGNLWHLMEHGTRRWMMAASAVALAGILLGIPVLVGQLQHVRAGSPLFLPTMICNLAGGFTVFAVGALKSQERVRLYRDWKLHPLSGKVLWLLGTVLFAAYALLVILDFGRGMSIAGTWAWLFVGLYFSLLGWSTLLITTAAGYRRFTAVQSAESLPARRS